MKRFVYSIIMIIGIFFCVNVASAFEIKSNLIISSPNESTVSNDTLGLEVQAKWDNRILVFISQEQYTKHLVGQTVGAYQVLGIGFGYTYPLSKYFSVSGRFGYYSPKMNYASGLSSQEAIYREMHRLSDPVNGWRTDPGVLCCEGYEIDYDMNTSKYEVGGNFGGSIRFGFNIPINKHVGFNIFVGYRLLELDTLISAKIKGLPARTDGGQAFHQFHGKDNLSGSRAGVGITVKW